MTITIKLINGNIVTPLCTNFLNSISAPRESIKFNEEMYRITRDIGARFEFVKPTEPGRIFEDVNLVFEDGKQASMFILKWS